MPHLTPDEIAHYQREGYVVPRYRLPAARINALCITLDRLIAENPGVRPEKLVSAHVERKPGQGVMLRASASAMRDSATGSSGARSRSSAMISTRPRHATTAGTSVL